MFQIRLISDDDPDVMKENLLKEFNGILISPERRPIRESRIKEAIVFIQNSDDFKHIIAKQYKEEYGITLSDEQISRILPEIANHFTMQLNLSNMGSTGMDAKNEQIRYSNAMANRVEATF